MHQASSPRRVSLCVAMIAGTFLGCAGCGIRDPYLTRSTSTAQRSPSPSAPRSAGSAATVIPTSPTTASATPRETGPDPANEGAAPGPVPAGAPGSARSVAYRFALAYANVSPATITARLRMMIALATPAYAASLRGTDGRARSAALRALSPGGAMVAKILSIQLSPPQGSFESAAVTMQQALVEANRAGEQPITTSYQIDLLQQHGGWRVADFEAQP